MKKISGQRFDEERALYGSSGLCLEKCAFAGDADGESALKESRNIELIDCFCDLRYPFWHNTDLKIINCELTEKCRAAVWYSDDVTVKNSRLNGIKAFRECSGVTIEGCNIASPEFGWSCNRLTMSDSTAESEYFMLRSKELRFENVLLNGKYSFQYVENAVFENCRFNTKDAFWHGKHITVRNSVINGEYFAWYSEDLTLENCVITGTQPLCYCKGLKLIGCVMNDADLSFERSETDAEILSHVTSIKNPYKGKIKVHSVGEIIMTDEKAHGEIEVIGGDTINII